MRNTQQNRSPLQIPAQSRLYEPLDKNAILKGHGGRQAKQPIFTAEQAG
jgi:hypothetical protein